MSGKRATCLAGLVLAILASAGGAASGAYVVGFSNITHNDAANAATAGQYSVTVYGSADNVSAYGFSPLGVNEALFVFRNTAAQASSITDVYFQDGTLLAMGASHQSAGVSFDGPATPGNLPGGNALAPAFRTTEQWSSDSNVPVMSNGINGSSEWLAIDFTLQSGQTYADVVNALIAGYVAPGSVWNNDGTDQPGGAIGLRFGIHVQGFANGRSESFVSGAGVAVVPEPSAVVLALIGSAGAGLATLRRYRRLVAVAAA